MSLKDMTAEAGDLMSIAIEEGADESERRSSFAIAVSSLVARARADALREVSRACDKNGRMTRRDFCYWLQGFTEDNETLFPAQVKVIRSRLDQVLGQGLALPPGKVET